MEIFFGNARFDPARSSGDRTHIESLIGGLHGLGHRVWVQPGSGVQDGHVIPEGTLARWRVFSKIDATYLRFEGYPIGFNRRLRFETAELMWRKPVIWEMNATSDFCALMWAGTDREVDVETLDGQIRGLARKVRLAICNTEGLERYAHHLGIERTAVIPLGTDPALFHPEKRLFPDVVDQLGEVNVVWCGSAEIRWHDIDLIVSAARRLSDDERFKFFFIGRMEPIPDAPENMVFLGEVARDRLPSILNCMDVGLALYREPTWSRFGLYSSPLKLFDYMASELVVVVSPIEQVVTMIRDGDTGFLVPFGEPCELVDRLVRIANESPGSRTTIGRRARQEVLRYYNWRRVAEQTASEIAAVL